MITSRFPKRPAGLQPHAARLGAESRSSARSLRHAGDVGACWRAPRGTGYGHSARASAEKWFYLQVRVENPDERANPGVAGTFQYDESSGSVLTPVGNRERRVRAGARRKAILQHPGVHRTDPALAPAAAAASPSAWQRGLEPSGARADAQSARGGVCFGCRRRSEHGQAGFPQVPWQRWCQGCRRAAG